MKLEISIFYIFFFIILISCKNADNGKNYIQSKNEIIELQRIIEQKIEEENYDTSLVLINQLFKKNELRKDNVLLAKSYFLSGQLNYYIDDYSKGISDYSEAAKLSKDKDFELYARSLYRCGQCYYYNNDYNKAILLLDSALKYSKEKKLDEINANVYQSLARVYRQLNKFDTAIVLIKNAIEIFKRINSDEGIAYSYEAIGLILQNIGRNQDALTSYLKSLEIRKKLNDNDGIAINFVNIGTVYLQLGNFQEAIKYNQEALKYFEDVHNENGIANCLNNIGNSYENLIEENFSEENIKNLQIALTYYQKALEYRKKQKDTSEMANSLLNIGNIEARIVTENYIRQFGQNWEELIQKTYSLAKIEKDFLPALKNYKEALTIVEKFNDQQRIAMILNNIGKIYYESGNFIRSETNLKKALNICENNQLLYQKANILRDLGLLYKNKGLFEEALYYFNLSLNITIPNNYKYYTRYAYQYMADIFEKTKQFEKAYQYYKLAVQIKDTLLNEEKYKAIAELETKYQTREKETEIKLLNQQNELNKTKIKQANTIILFISLGITFIIIFLVIVFKQYNDKRKANIKLEEQNQLILKQKQDITDSITYASRIQSALMPTSEYLNQLLKDYFIIYKPKDIVSGDFYWISEQNNKIILVVADCTGHGVPGAFMSMLGNAFLNEITSGNDEIHTDEILNELRRNIIKSLHQNIDIQEHKDGMDAVVMIIDYKNLNLEFSGAYNPLIICRGNKIIELKGDRMPVGVHYFSDKLFTRQSIKIKSGDCIYAFSDGFQDQFGGEHLQKFMLKRMKDMFLEINNLSIDEQMRFIIKTHEEWKRNNPQIDDILLVGLKI